MRIIYTTKRSYDLPFSQMENLSYQHIAEGAAVNKRMVQHRVLFGLACGIALVSFVGLICVIAFAIKGMPAEIIEPRCKNAPLCNANCSYWRQDNVTTLCLSGSPLQMGNDYGSILNSELKYTKTILSKVMNHSSALLQAERFFSSLPQLYKTFLIGIANGSDLSLTDVKLLAAMETLSGFYNFTDNRLISGGAFLSIPANQSQTNSLLAATNHDFPQPFSMLPLVVTILRPTHYQPVAMVSFPGQVTCSTCISVNGLLTVINNAEVSGGFENLENTHRSMSNRGLINLQVDSTFEDLNRLFQSSMSDRSLIVSTASAKEVTSFEFSSKQELKRLVINQSTAFVATNVYNNKNWGNENCTKVNAPPPESDLQWGWYSRPRKQNLETAASGSSQLNVEKLKTIMDEPFNPLEPNKGGAKLNTTVYQTVIDIGSLSLNVRLCSIKTWVNVNLYQWQMNILPNSDS